jgi:hypothetical protein
MDCICNSVFVTHDRIWIFSDFILILGFFKMSMENRLIWKDGFHLFLKIRM